MNDLNKRIFVSRHRDMVGGAIKRLLQAQGHAQIVIRTHDQLALTDQSQVKTFFEELRPQQVNLAAPKVGGVLEATNEPYGAAKIVGSVITTDLHGPGDNCHPQNSHVLPGLIRQFREAKLTGAPAVMVWGNGTVKREFLHVDAVAAAWLHVMTMDRASYDAVTLPTQSHINVETGEDLSILDLAKFVQRVVGYESALTFYRSKPDSTPRTRLDISKLKALGWALGVKLAEGIWQCLRRFYATADQGSAGSGLKAVLFRTPWP